MKNTKISLLIVAAMAATSLTSCTVHSRAVQSSPVIARAVQLDPIKADINVHQGRKLTGEGSATYVFGIRVSDMSEMHQIEGVRYSQDSGKMTGRGRKTARAIAAYNAMESCPECDVMVNPKYEVTVQKSPLGLIFKKYTVRVTAYGANYENFRTERQTKIIGDNNKEYIVVEE